jgi:hypothetical protein
MFDIILNLKLFIWLFLTSQTGICKYFSYYFVDHMCCSRLTYIEWHLNKYINYMKLVKKDNRLLWIENDYN